MPGPIAAPIPGRRTGEVLGFRLLVADGVAASPAGGSVRELRTAWLASRRDIDVCRAGTAACR